MRLAPTTALIIIGTAAVVWVVTKVIVKDPHIHVGREVKGCSSSRVNHGETAADSGSGLRLAMGRQPSGMLQLIASEMRSDRHVRYSECFLGHQGGGTVP